MSTASVSRPDEDDPLAIRPPRQRRSREAWARVLDSGLAILEEGGYSAFTIAAVCDRAQVAPRAIYDRADTKDALFLAVYEHGIARVRESEAVFSDVPRWKGLSPDRLADEVVAQVAGVFEANGPFLRSVVLISGVHPEVYRRGGEYAQALGDKVTDGLMLARRDIQHRDPETAARAAFTIVFSALVLRVAYGPTFATASAPADDEFLNSLSIMVSQYLFSPRP